MDASNVDCPAHLSTNAVMGIKPEVYLSKQLVDVSISLYRAHTSGLCTSYVPAIVVLQRLITAVGGCCVLLAMAHYTGSGSL